MVSAENLKGKSLHARVKGQEERSLKDRTLKAVHTFDLIVTSLALQCGTSFGHILVLIVRKSFQISHSRDGPLAKRVPMPLAEPHAFMHVSRMGSKRTDGRSGKASAME